MTVSEETARRIAEALERLLKVIEASHFERFVGGVRHDPIVPPCADCGGVGGFHRHNCLKLASY